MTLVRDEHGLEWLVVRGDPAWPHVRTLTKAGFTDIVLPEEAIIEGSLPELPDPTPIEQMRETYEQLERSGIANPLILRALGKRFLDALGLYEACAHLRNTV